MQFSPRVQRQGVCVEIYESIKKRLGKSPGHIRPCIDGLWPPEARGSDGVSGYNPYIYKVRGYMKLKDFCAILS